jgi:hypothetical protein
MFFDVSDGFYLNYVWNEQLIADSAKLAKERNLDVFAGIDVWGK